MGACPNSKRIRRIRARMRGELAVEPGKPCPRRGTIASCHGGERGVEFRGHTETGNNVAKLNDRAADRECRQQLRPLQRLSLVRQCCESAVHKALPVVGRPQDGISSEAAQIAQGQSEEATRSQRRRQRRQQAKRNRRCGAACKDRQRRVVVLDGIVVHLVLGREESHKEHGHAGEHRHEGRPAVGHTKAHWDEKQTECNAEGREGAQRRKHGEVGDPRQKHAKGWADHELHRRGGSLVALRRHQQEHDRGECYRQRATWPCGHDPEQRGTADGDERAPSIDQQPAANRARSAGTCDGQEEAGQTRRQAALGPRARAGCRPTT